MVASSGWICRFGNKKAALKGAAGGPTHVASSRSRPSGGAATTSDAHVIYHEQVHVAE